MLTVVENKTGTRHLSDDGGYTTFCGLSARRMREVKPPPASSWEEEERWRLNATMCARCRRTAKYEFYILP